MADRSSKWWTATLAVGDAAGLVMPSNGGGISQAIISGCFAAESILDHLHHQTPLTTYEAKVRASMGPALKNSPRSKNMGYAHGGDVLTELILRILGPIGGIKRAMECERPLWLIGARGPTSINISSVCSSGLTVGLDHARDRPPS